MAVCEFQRDFPLQPLQREPPFLLLQVIPPSFFFFSIFCCCCSNYVKCGFISFLEKKIRIKTMGNGCW